MARLIYLKNHCLFDILWLLDCPKYKTSPNFCLTARFSLYFYENSTCHFTCEKHMDLEHFRPKSSD